MGATASGKSSVAMSVARTLGDVDLVSVDSMQVYRGMDIGTAKPSSAERAEVPHHGLDLVDPWQPFGVAEFRRAHDRALGVIASAGRRALLVGGTGLYHRVVIDDFDLPGQWPAVRAELESQSDTEALHRRLTELDPASATKIEHSNRRRIVRALEVTVGGGRPFSSYGPGVDTYPPSPVVQIGLRRPRPVIAERIARRLEQMLAAGFVDEVRGLMPGGFSHTAAQALGYRELVAYLEGRIGEDEAIQLVIAHTRRFAVRQDRWFRRDPRVRWLDVDDDGDLSLVTAAVIDALEQPA